MKDSLVKSAALLMGLTLISRVFGFAREVTQAYFFGADIYTDAYLVAMTIPIVLFSTVSGGINNVFIPVYDRYRSKGRDKALVWKFAQIGMVLSLLVFIVPVFVNTDLAIRVFAPAFSDQATSLAGGMLRVLIFVIFFRLLASITTAILHVNRNFLVPGMVGIPFSLCIMGFSFLVSSKLGIYALVWGTLIGFGIQFFVMLPWLLKIKMGGSIRDKASDGLKEIAVLFPPVFMGTLAGQAKTLIDRMFASGLDEGSISFLNYAVRIRDLPNGFFIATVVTVLYPTLVTHVNKRDWQEYRSSIANALNIMTFMLLPAVVGFFVLAVPITQLVYQRGHFDSHAAVATASALRWFTPGLLGTMLYQLMVKAFYSQRDTKTPLLAMVLMVAINALLNFLLLKFMDHSGLALATSLATIIGSLFMFNRLSSKTGAILNDSTLVDMAKSAISALVMGVVCWGVYNIAVPHIPESFTGRAIYTGGIILIGAGVYFTLAYTLKISAMQDAANMLRQLVTKMKSKGKNPPGHTLD